MYKITRYNVDGTDWALIEDPSGVLADAEQTMQVLGSLTEALDSITRGFEAACDTLNQLNKRSAELRKERDRMATELLALRLKYDDWQVINGPPV